MGAEKPPWKLISMMYATDADAALNTLSKAYLDEKASRQVKRDREKRRGRRQARAQEASEGTTPAG